MHCFYFEIPESTVDRELQTKRISRIEDAAIRQGFEIERSAIDTTITLYVEVPDEESAIMFKLAVEAAKYSGPC
jgi:hypothetical protein